MKIYWLALEMVASVYRLADEVKRRDPDLARQMRRASASVVQNLGEGMYSQGGRKVSRYFDSMGSARETTACLHICVATQQLTQAIGPSTKPSPAPTLDRAIVHRTEALLTN
jgi:four helix bundle protein